MDPKIIAAIVVAIIILVIFLLNRKPSDVEETTEKATPPVKAEKPKKTILEKRIEVDAAIEIHDGMSLAEIKKAKSAKIRGNKGKRETALQATAKSKEAHQEEEADESMVEPKEETIVNGESEVDDLWGEILSETSERTTVDISPPKGTREETDSSPSEEIREEVQSKTKEIEAEHVPEESKINESRGLEVYSQAEETSLEDGLKKTRTGFIKRLGKFFSGPELAEDLIDEIEEVLYTADIGPKAASHIVGVLEEQMSGEKDPQKVWAFVREYVESLLVKREKAIDIDSESPFVFMIIGVNGVGKTTTIGKLASKYKREGKKVLLVAGDTFRAAAVEQLQVWGERAGIPVHAGESEADPASVVYSGVERGKEEGFDIIICDTAGRLHTKAPLLDELKKMGRVTQKVIPNAPHETILVLDANTGQNAIQQALVFNTAVPITGIVLTKLDGTAKGGVILGICEELDAPIRFIGIGEGVHDLRTFNAVEFTEALFM